MKLLLKIIYEYFTIFPVMNEFNDKGLYFLSCMMFFCAWLLLIFLLYGLGSYLFSFIDFSFINSITKPGIIDDKYYQQPYVEKTWVFNPATKTMMPDSIKHDEKWILIIAVGDKKEYFYTNKDFFGSCHKGDTMKVKQKIGFFSKRINILSIQHT